MIYFTIILLVLQISSTGGIYPVEVMPAFFKAINPYLPMTYAITMLREACSHNVCKVNVGDEVLQIVCGAPNVRKGLKVIVALDGAVLPGDFKIKKSMKRGVESCGMLCSLAELGLDSKFLTEADKEALMPFKEVDENVTAIDALETIATGKADKVHTHRWNDIEDKPFYDTKNTLY